MTTQAGVLALRAAEFASYLGGCLLSALFLGYLAWGEVARQEGVAEFTALTRAEVPVGAAPVAGFGEVSPPDTSLWAPGRLEHYRASLSAALPPVLGILEISAIGLQVPVYPSDSELALNRGAAVIRGMAFPHEAGNIGIAGHRDGYFRVLKDIKVGDVIDLQTLAGEKRFRVQGTRIVEKNDTSLLQATRGQTLTLVTCYPFYYVGPAPRRFIVTATPDTQTSKPG